MTQTRILGPVVAVAAVAIVGVAGYLTRGQWLPWLSPPAVGQPTAEQAAEAPPANVILTDQAIANLGLVARPLKTGSHWKTVIVPGAVVDRPGLSDRSV